MPTNKLTDRQCKAAEPAGKGIKLFDGGGLYLFVTPTGSKIWRLAYRLAGKAQTMSFGPYPEVSLAKARERRDEAKAALREGADPMAPRRQSRAGMTLREASEQYWNGRRDLSPSYLMNARRAIAMHILPKLGDRKIASIEREDLMKELQRMDAAGLAVYVRKVRMWLGQVFDWAVENGYAKINPALLIDPRKAFSAARVEHFAAIKVEEVPALMQRLACERDLQSVLACRLLALTWVRTTELRLMEWSEIDAEQKIWRISAGKMKRRRDHLVPLSSQALQILTELKSRARGSKYVFPAEHRTADDRRGHDHFPSCLPARKLNFRRCWKTRTARMVLHGPILVRGLGD
jgi:integrase